MVRSRGFGDGHVCALSEACSVVYNQHNGVGLDGAHACLFPGPRGWTLEIFGAPTLDTVAAKSSSCIKIFN